MASKKVDFKKESQAGYQATIKPAIIDLPAIPFIMVDGKGDPNTSADYKQAVELLYALSYAIKMSPKRGNVPNGYFDYVIPPLEGLWQIKAGENPTGNDLDKSNFSWTAMIANLIL